MQNLPMNRADMLDAITAMPGDQGWTSREAETAFRELAARLVIYGLSPRRAYETLGQAFHIVSTEVDRCKQSEATP